MIDTIKLTGVISPPKEVEDRVLNPIEWNGLTFYPDVYNFGLKVLYKARFDNLTLIIFEDNLTIINSLQKYYCGNNYSDFHLKDIKNAFQKLSYELSLPIEKFKVKSIDYGVNLPLEAAKVYPYWTEFKNKKFAPMISKGKTYGKKVFMIEYAIKGYDKTLEAKRHNGIDIRKDLFRFEVGVKRMRHLTKRRSNPINIHYAQDLFKKSNLIALSNDLLLKFNSIKRETLFNLEGLTIAEKNIIAVMQNPIHKEDRMKNNKEAYRKYKRRYNQLIEKAGRELGLDITSLLKSKINELI